MEFLDEEAFEPSEVGGGPPRRHGPPDRQQLMVRRAVGAGAILLVFILVVLGIKGCLNARKERGFENYVSDLSSVVAETNTLSANYFKLFNDPGKLSETQFQAQIQAARGTAEDLLTRVQNLDTPDELKSDQGQLELSYTLRRDALTGIDGNMDAALGSTGRTDAINAIADYMRYLLASDVLFARARGQIDPVLSDEGIEVDGKPAKVPESIFLPDDRWLDPLEISTALALVGGVEATSGTHGLALLATTVKPGDVALSPDSPVSVSGNGPYEVDVQVQNQGDSDEADVIVSVEVTGGPETITGDTTIPKIVAGGTQTASITLDPDPPAGQEVTVTVTVLAVPGEQLTTNNTSTYQVTFG